MTTTDPNPDPIDDVFNQWYDQFGVRYYSTDGHKAYMKYAFTNGLIHGLNAANAIQHKFPQRKRKSGRSIFRYP
jgi:hypothetical protein